MPFLLYRNVDWVADVYPEGFGDSFVFPETFYSAMYWTAVPRCYTMLLMRKKLTAIRLKPEQIKKLDKIARREDLPVSWLIRKAIDEFLKRKK